MQSIIYAAVILGIIALIAAVILHFVSKAFQVIEDPRIDDVASILPGANCGGCGFAGCRNLAEAIVKAGTLEGFGCPAGGSSVNEGIAQVLGLNAVMMNPIIAVVRCNGSLENAPSQSSYDGAPSCAFASSLYAGESMCSCGCLGYGDCMKVCNFDALSIDPNTKLPVVDNEKCVACGACAKACPRLLIEMRFKGKKDRRIFVACRNIDKGAAAKKNCQVACIGCGKCLKVCEFDAITIANNLAYIDHTKCKLCRKCVSECPANAICECNFPPKKDKIELAQETQFVNN
ncbi:MAG: RnfABCDGE type electron transport complex subunit B [Bacteroidales bacterium]|nr:RnfABCDGE type electron transport complex subunit B [Bacteroidales bacterium]